MMLTHKLNTMKASGNRFTLTFDEYTARNNERFLNVSLKMLGQSYNLGLKMIDGPADSRNLIDTITAVLNKFEVSLDDDITAMCK